MNFRARTHPSHFLISGICLLAILYGSAATASLSPEEEVLRISKLLKPIPDEQWNQIAGNKVSESYEIHQGDTLYDISKRLFGDSRFWPKIWAMNNGKILNPHQITPGRMIAFMSGTGNSLPSVSLQDQGQETVKDSSPVNASDPVLSKGRSLEWQNLKRQPWENVNLTLPPEVDPQGFDSRNKIRFKVNTGFEIDAVSTSGKIPFLGEITSARVDHPNLSLGDTVYIHSEQSLQVGDIYAVTQEPQYLESEHTENGTDAKSGETKKREGYSYLILGKIKILGGRDQHFIGEVLTSKHPIPRGAGLMRVPPRIQNLSPLPGPVAVEGKLLLNKSFSSYATAQHKQVIIDRGSRDGVKPGMVFRNYQAKDPMNQNKLERSDSLVTADVMIIQCSDEFSSGVVLRSLSQVSEGEMLTLLTDVSHLRTRAGGPVGILDADQTKDGKTSNELDSLDSDLDEKLGSDEERELKQLERWQKNPDKTAPPTPEASPSLSPTPSAGPSPEPLPRAEPLPDLSLPELAPELPPAPVDTPKKEAPLEVPKTAPDAKKDGLDSILDSGTPGAETLPVPAPAPEAIPPAANELPADPALSPPL